MKVNYSVHDSPMVMEVSNALNNTDYKDTKGFKLVTPTQTYRGFFDENIMSMFTTSTKVNIMENRGEKWHYDCVLIQDALI